MTRTEKLAAVRNILAASNSYDAATVSISRAGEVTARRDANKTFGGHDATRYLVGYVDDMLRDGQ